jgi:catechol 2,3-dioxygenase-like lactoylglutathione lyase family enzyme
MFHHIDHIAVTVSDLDRSSEFYRLAFGFVEVARWAPNTPEVDGIVFLELGECRLELIAQKQARPSRNEGTAGLRHICLRTGDLDEEARRLTAQGVHFLKQPQTLDGQLYHELLSHRDYPVTRGLRRALLEDPDGVVIELLEG